jgi:hypothetical protein
MSLSNQYSPPYLSISKGKVQVISRPSLFVSALPGKGFQVKAFGRSGHSIPLGHVRVYKTWAVDVDTLILRVGTGQLLMLDKATLAEAKANLQGNVLFPVEKLSLIDALPEAKPVPVYDFSH